MAASPKLLLGTFVRDDRHQFLEWVAYHRTIGATDIHVFTDIRNKARRPLLDALAANDVIIIHPVVLDPNVGDDDRNAALRFAAIEQQETSGYGLYIADTEYFRINGDFSEIQSLMEGSHDADVLSAPVTVLGFSETAGDYTGRTMSEARARARLPFNDPANRHLRSVARLGVFPTRAPEVPTGAVVANGNLSWVNGDGEHMPKPLSRISWLGKPCLNGTAKAEILRVPGSTREAYLLRIAALPSVQQPKPDRITVEIDALSARGKFDKALSAHQEATSRELAALMAMEGVAEAAKTLRETEAARLKALQTDASALEQFVPAGLSTSETEPEQVPGTELAPSEAPDDLDGERIKAEAPFLPRWFEEIHTGGDKQGFYKRLQNHAIACIRRDDSHLIFTFDNLSNVEDRSPDREPWAYKFVRDSGYSHLSVMARRKDWYRDKQLIEYLEKLSGDGFFKQFDSVLLAGTSMGGFAALAFASLVPGATVISFSPQTTLDSTLVPWEERFIIGQNRDWSLPYSDCAYEIDEVEKAYILYDPFFKADRRHVERLEGDNVIHLKTWFAGHFSPVFLRRANLLKPVMSHAINGTLTPEVFYAMYRERRFLPWYRKSLELNLQERGHPKLASLVAPAFRKLKREAVQMGSIHQNSIGQ